LASYWQIDSTRLSDVEDLGHRWKVPGIQCPACTTWAKVGPALPSVSLAGHPLETEFLRGGTRRLERWKTLRDAIQPLLPVPDQVVPGLGLGPLKGRVPGPFQMAWIGGWGFLTSAMFRDQLAKLAPEIAAVKGEIESPSGDEYFELEIRSRGRLIGTATEEPCPMCNSQVIEYPKDPPQILGVPELPLFRLENLPTIIVAHESLLPLFRRGLGPKATFRPIRIAA
jgi:hypothetical protein